MFAWFCYFSALLLCVTFPRYFFFLVFSLFLFYFFIISFSCFRSFFLFIFLFFLCFFKTQQYSLLLHVKLLFSFSSFSFLSSPFPFLFSFLFSHSHYYFSSPYHPLTHSSNPKTPLSLPLLSSMGRVISINKIPLSPTSIQSNTPSSPSLSTQSITITHDESIPITIIPINRLDNSNQLI